LAQEEFPEGPARVARSFGPPVFAPALKRLSHRLMNIPLPGDGEAPGLRHDQQQTFHRPPQDSLVRQRLQPTTSVAASRREEWVKS